MGTPLYYKRDGLQVLIIFLFNSIIITSQKLCCLNYRSFDRRSYFEIPRKEIIYASVHLLYSVPDISSTFAKNDNKGVG